VAPNCFGVRSLEIAKASLHGEQLDTRKDGVRQVAFPRSNGSLQGPHGVNTVQADHAGSWPSASDKLSRHIGRRH
jgi:hypothetical protein